MLPEGVRRLHSSLVQVTVILVLSILWCHRNIKKARDQLLLAFILVLTHVWWLSLHDLYTPLEVLISQLCHTGVKFPTHAFGDAFQPQWWLLLFLFCFVFFPSLFFFFLWHGVLTQANLEFLASDDLPILATGTRHTLHAPSFQGRLFFKSTLYQQLSGVTRSIKNYQEAVCIPSLVIPICRQIWETLSLID